MADLSERRILVTGGSMGIGLEVCRALAADGARVVIAARGEAALSEATSSLGGEGHEAVRLDVSDAAAWPSAMEGIDAGGPLDGLVTAAAVIDPIGRISEVSMDAFAATIAINVLGTALSLHHVLPRLEASGGRAVTFSGGGGTSPLTRFDAYAASKAAVVRLSENIATDTAIEVNCVSPGFVATRIHGSTLAAGPEGAGADYHAKTQRQLEEGGFPAAEAAALVAFLLGDDARGITGRVISAQWDPWREPAFQERLRRDPDLARVRRIDDQFFVSKS